MVNDLFDRLVAFTDRAQYIVRKNTLVGYPATDISEFIKGQIRPLVSQVKHHASFDTLAKKLFINGDNQRLFLLKGLLNIFLEFEEAGLAKVTGKVGLASKIEIAKDLRYDSFLATFLDPNSIYIPENIKVITWNYDNQWEKSYRDFANCTMAEARINLSIYPFVNNENVQIIKLNGSAGALLGTDQEHELIEGTGQIVDYDSILLDQIAFLYYAQKARPLKSVSTIQFAWEIDDDQGVKLAREILNNTQVLVISGYSFPEFNRAIDNILFSGQEFKEVYLQIPENNYQDIEVRASSVISQKPIPYPDVSRACIPPTAFVAYSPPHEPFLEM